MVNHTSIQIHIQLFDLVLVYMCIEFVNPALKICVEMIKIKSNMYRLVSV